MSLPLLLIVQTELCVNPRNTAIAAGVSRDLAHPGACVRSGYLRGVISVAIQNSLSAIGHSTIKTAKAKVVKLKRLSSEKSCPPACRLVTCLPDATCFILEGLGKSAP